ncbi:MAG TPA: hypothetical protein VIV11_31885 [Kofleriaceae bacterium]
MKRLLLMFAVLSAAVYVGCKQEEGARCQVNADCASGLCNKAKGTCSLNEDNMDIDATVPDPIDGLFLDAPTPDAPSDAPTD